MKWLALIALLFADKLCRPNRRMSPVCTVQIGDLKLESGDARFVLSL